MLRSALLGVGLAAAAATTAAAQGYYGYPYHPYSYGNPYYSAPYYSGYDAPGYYTGWPSSYSLQLSVGIFGRLRVALRLGLPAGTGLLRPVCRSPPVFG